MVTKLFLGGCHNNPSVVDRGEAGSIRNLLSFSSSTVENKNRFCRTIWGGNFMYVEID